jgi:hypothetical protein
MRQCFSSRFERPIKKRPPALPEDIECSGAAFAMGAMAR